MKVLITGGGGFLGKSVSKAFTKDGHLVITASRSEGGYDLTVSENAEDMLAYYNPDVVVHLAASVGGIGANCENPGRFFYENMAMGMNVIEAAHWYTTHKPNLKVVFLGTTCSYPKFTPTPFRESDLWNGYPEETNAPYGVAKRALIVMAQAYRQQYGLNTISLLPANLYGPNDNFHPGSSHVIPALIRKFVEAKEAGSGIVEVWGTGKVSREFLYVDDAAEAIVKATEHYNGSEPVNIGSGEEIFIGDLVHMIKTIVGYEGEVVWNSNQPDGQPRRRLDTTRALEFGFKASTPLRQGLIKTVQWYLENR